MPYKAHILKVSTGETRVRDIDLDWGDSSEYWWTCGNFGCDCNRELEFRRAGGEPELIEPEDTKCGETGFLVSWNAKLGQICPDCQEKP